jgi:peptide/nickel transport system substrate-binding protein
MTRPLLAVILLCLLPWSAPAQQGRDEGTLVIAVAREPTSPVPTLWHNDGANQEASDLLFLRLADLGPTVNTADERTFIPRLARSWQRRDPVTLVFDLDPRARWHDGAPVTAADVVLGMNRARDPKLSPQISTLLRRIRSVTAEGDRRVVVRFTEPYAEQMYDATYQALPLPAHLLGAMPPESVQTSAFAQQPVGNGPYRFARRVPGQLLELQANDRFFLGAPRLKRVLFLLARDPEARLNLLLSGAADAIDNIYSLPNPSRIEKLPSFNYYPVPGLVLSYITFNQRDPADTSRPHPILSDVAVRHALVVALDRIAIARSAYGPLAGTPGAPVSALLARSVDAPPSPPYDTALARRLLNERGWQDHDGDGVLDKNGRPLALRLMVPSVVAPRKLMATQIQEALRRLGVQLDLDLVEPGVYMLRRAAGRFDLEFWGVTQDPSPAGLVQSWTCAGIGGSNVAHYCDPAVDSLIAAAIKAGPNASARWGVALGRMADDYPAIFMTAQVYSAAVHRRFDRVTLRPGSTWSDVWQWTVRPGEQIERDREGR